MDLLTQGLLGSAVAASVSNPKEIRKAGLIGLLSGLSADVDFFIRSSQDPLLNLEFHRHFTHSIFFIPLAALILSLLFWPFFKKSLGWKKIYVYAFAGYCLSGFIDACTSYGTRLLWPLSEDRISFNIISIIDPVFTLVLLVGAVIALKIRKPVAIRVFLLLASTYLLLGLLQNQRVQLASYKLAQQQGHEIQRLLVKPTLGNLWLWRSVYLSQGSYYVNAIRINPFTQETMIYSGTSIKQLSTEQLKSDVAVDSVLFKDIQRFADFSSDYLAYHPLHEDVIIDVRYSNLPHTTLPLWGIRLNTQRPESHARYELYRDSSKTTRQQFINMLLGKTI